MDAHGFRGKAAVITGASSGIGRATALALAREGANLALAARREDALREAQSEARALGADVLVIPTDVTDRVQISRLVQGTLQHFGKIDVLVANAGVYFRRPVRELTVEDVERVMQVNFYGPLYCILEVLPHMLDRRTGHIVVVSSMDAKKGLPPDGAYVASKCAVAGLAEVLRQELRGTGVHLTTVFPGRIDTPMIEGIEVPRVAAKKPPEMVARAIVRAIEKRQIEVITPSNGKVLAVANAISPRFGDWFVRVSKVGGWDEPAPRMTRPA